MAEDCSSTHLVNGDGELNDAGLENFMRSVNLSDCDLSYAVVAIMGPQSSGKSTLLNHLFNTKFVMMDSTEGSSQTTVGIWMAMAVNIANPLTIIMDIEGNDGIERGENDTFEKQTALYALALADIVLINISYKDIKRVKGANKQLLETVFEAMMKLFPPRKTTLLFVVRDTDKNTPAKILESDLKNTIQKIWEEVPKPDERKNAALVDFFIVEVIGLSNFLYQRDQFDDEVAQLREQFKNSIDLGGLAGDSQGRVPGSAFSMSAHNIWKVIKENRDLDLPSLKKMVAAFRCDAIASEKLSRLVEDKGWLALEVSAKSGPVSDFGKQLSSILNTHLSEYEKEAMYFDEDVRDARRVELESDMLTLVQPTYATLLGHHLSQAKQNFETQLETLLSRGEGFAASVRVCKESCMLEFDKQCEDVAVHQASHWDTTNVREKLMRDIEAHSSALHSKKLSEIVAYSKKTLSEAIDVKNIEGMLIDSGGSWPRIRKIFKHETKTVVSELLFSVSGFELDDSTCNQILQSLRDYARSIVEKKARKEAGKVLTHMKNRFTSAFNEDQDSMPRRWTTKDDINQITQEARSESLKILSSLAIIRLEEIPDNIEKILFSSIMNKSTNESFSHDPLVMSVWEEVSPADTIITPVECKSFWRQFLEENGTPITQAIITQEANKAIDAAIAGAEAATSVAIAEAAAKVVLAEAAAKVAIAEADAKAAKAEAAIEIAKREAIAAAEIAQTATKAAIAEANAAVLRADAAAKATQTEAAIAAITAQVAIATLKVEEANARAEAANASAVAANRRAQTPLSLHPGIECTIV